MIAEPAPRPGPCALLLAGGLAAMLAAGCATLMPPPRDEAPQAATAPPPPPEPAPQAAPCALAHGDGDGDGDGDEDPLEALWHFHRATRGLGPAELARERAALAAGGGTPLALMQQALLVSRPPGGKLARALALVEMVLAAEQAEAQALHPAARLLADQLAERQRLEATNERLTQQLERTGQQLKESQRQADQLREKLEALAEIERTLPGRPPAAAPAEPAEPERRTPP